MADEPVGQRLLVVRHGEVPGLDETLWGRTPGVSLTREGRAQAQVLARGLAGTPVDEIRTSPQPRAVQTSHILSIATGAPVTIDAALDEFDFGAWTGRSFRALAKDAGWLAYNQSRAASGAPGGESVAAFAARVRGVLEAAAASQARTLCLVTHAEVIRTMLLICLGEDLDQWSRVDVPPASLSVLELTGRGLTIVTPDS